MRDVLQEIVAHKRQEVAAAKEQLPPRSLYAKVEQALSMPCRSMSRALAESPSGIIAEFKRRSPSKGWIKEEGRPDVIPPAYAQGGAAALSILTDSVYFGGSLDFIRIARPMVDIPVMRKEFVIDEYQLFEARLAGADAVLLIAACLSRQECATLAATARELGMEVLLELHGEGELDYAAIEVPMLGVNNRNLGSFVTDVRHSFSMIGRLPSDRVLVSESGLSNPATVRELRQAGYRGFLMGEQFMKHADPGEALKEFIGQL